MKEDTQLVIQRLRKGLGAQGFSQAVNLFIRLAEVPLFLAFWGPERYGEWLMVAAIPAYLAMADGGFTGTTQREMTMRMGAGDRQGALASFQSTWVLLLILSTALFGVFALAVTLLPLSDWLKLSSMSSTALQYVILLLTAHVIVGFQCGLIYGGYSCEGRYGRGTVLATFMYLFDFAGLTIAVVLGGGPVEAAMGYLAGRLLGYLIFLFDLKNVAPWLRRGWKNATSANVATLVRPSFASMAFPLGEALNIQGMRLLIGLMLGPIAVTVFSTLRTLCRSAMKPTLIVARLIEPEMALAFGGGRHNLIQKLFTKSSQITLWSVLPACLLLWFLGEPLLGLWTRGQIKLDVSLYILLLLSSAANSLWSTALMVPYATNRHEGVAVRFLIINGALLLLAGFLMSSIGLSGAGVALLFSELAMAVWVLRAAFSLSEVPLGYWLRAVVRPPIPAFKAILRKAFFRS